MEKYGQYSGVIKALQRYAEAHTQSLKAAGQRAELPAGSSRARVTSANAKWARHAEARELAWDAFNIEANRLGWDIQVCPEGSKSQPADKYGDLNDMGKSFAKFIEGLGYSVEVVTDKKKGPDHA